jgi:hypothetical protein
MIRTVRLFTSISWGGARAFFFLDELDVLDSRWMLDQ